MFGLDDYTAGNDPLRAKVDALSQNVNTNAIVSFQAEKKLKKRIKELEKACQMSDAVINEILQRLRKLEKMPDMSIDPLWEEPGASGGVTHIWPGIGNEAPSTMTISNPSWEQKK